MLEHNRQHLGARFSTSDGKHTGEGGILLKDNLGWVFHIMLCSHLAKCVTRIISGCFQVQHVSLRTIISYTLSMAANVAVCNIVVRSSIWYCGAVCGAV